MGKADLGLNREVSVRLTIASDSPDAYVVVPPPSPSDSIPPLGPALLARAADERGFRVRVIDLNAKWLRGFATTPRSLHPHLVGDQGKDRALVARAARQLFADTGLAERAPLHCPAAADPVAGMHYSFEGISNALEDAYGRETWCRLLEENLFAEMADGPAVVGVSLMGPSQVFLGLLVLAAVKRRYPAAITVLGGSHVTLLRQEMMAEARYHKFVDVVLPGHSERAFVDLLQLVAHGRKGDLRRLTLREPLVDHRFSYRPLFEAPHLGLYDREVLAVPLQFTRGCVYARCRYCTYPVVEKETTAFRAADARNAVEELIASHGITRISVVDSLFTVPMMRAFASALLRPPRLPVRWSATTKVNRALIEAAPMLAESGLTTLDFGVESIMPASQELLRKKEALANIEDVLLGCAASGITAVVNLIFGLPGETEADAQRQLDWYLDLRATAPPGRMNCSLNLLEITRQSPLALTPPPGVVLRGAAPWAYCYDWNAPEWRADFAPALRDVELSH